MGHLGDRDRDRLTERDGGAGRGWIMGRPHSQLVTLVVSGLAVGARALVVTAVLPLLTLVVVLSLVFTRACNPNHSV